MKMLDMSEVLTALGKYRAHSFRGRYIRSSRSEMFKSAFGSFKNKNVLDVGCHAGFYSFFISNYASRVTGIDIDESLIQEAKDAQSKLGVENIEFLNNSIFDLTVDFVKEKSIDAVFIHKTGGTFSEEEYQQMISIFVSSGVSSIVTNVSPSDGDKAIERYVQKKYGKSCSWRKIPPRLISIKLQ